MLNIALIAIERVRTCENFYGVLGRWELHFNKDMSKSQYDNMPRKLVDSSPQNSPHYGDEGSVPPGPPARCWLVARASCLNTGD